MNKTIAVIGLGYVGLPLAVEFGKSRKTIGYDISKERVAELSKGVDRTLEVTSDDLKNASDLSFSTDISDLKDASIYIVTVPTPVDKNNKPDLMPLILSSRALSTVLCKDDIVIYESTVYPGCTEEVCVPVLEESGLVYNKDFFCGYSPERINPGDKVNTLTTIMKVTSGSTPEVAKEVDELYKSIVKAGTYSVSSIKVAEASKVIENSQRDLNIAFVNELALLFDRLGIDTNEVLNAAGTKWNFLKFKPGLVGGHCIGIDPYYLTHKAEEVGYHPEIILAGRRLNDNMGKYVGQQVVKGLINKGHRVKDAKVLILGITFKENCTDIRNTRVIDIYEELKEFGCDVQVTDSWADKNEVKHEFGIDLVEYSSDKISDYNAVILAVSHKEYADLHTNANFTNDMFIYDVKGVLPIGVADQRL